LNIQREDYQKLLHDQAVELGVKIKFGCKVDVIDQATPSITLANEEILKPDLIIGADGKLHHPFLLRGLNIYQVPDQKSAQQF
jgi:2-polyprenyl-6-methoxyphenol hydroxylase-like FAD-dependent oxidoreductase